MVYNYKINIEKVRNRSLSETVTGQSFENLNNNNSGGIKGFNKGVDSKGYGPGDEQYYGLVEATRNITNEIITNRFKNRGSWGNKNQEKIDFGKDAFSSAAKKDSLYKLEKKNTIQNFTLPNGQNLLSFLKENNVRTGDNVEIIITKDGVQLNKKK